MYKWLNRLITLFFFVIEDIFMWKCIVEMIWQYNKVRIIDWPIESDFFAAAKTQTVNKYCKTNIHAE